MTPRILLLALCLISAAPLYAQSYTLEIGQLEFPEKVPAQLAPALETRTFTLLKDGSRMLNLWLRRELPADTGDTAAGELHYASLELGALVGIIEVIVPHIDYRDQMAPPGVFVLRYLQQPVDGAHVGVTYFRDFLVMNPLRSNTDTESRGFNSTLAAALQLNTHPYAWGLWPARELAFAETPQLVVIDDDKWVLTVVLPRAGGQTLPLGIVLAGSQPPDFY